MQKCWHCGDEIKQHEVVDLIPVDLKHRRFKAPHHQWCGKVVRSDD